MTGSERIWRAQRLTGRVAMVLLTLALLALFDGLRGGFLGSSGQIHLIPGERYLLSGPLPPKTESIEGFVIEGAAADGSVRLVPEGIYTGFMLGGGMWRGHLAVDGQAGPGTYEIRVRDRFGEKQNPALVFTVRVFRNAGERQAASASFVTRRSGLEPRIVAACLGLLGVLTGCGNYLLGRKWHFALVEQGCGQVFRLKTVDGRQEATADMGVESRVTAGSAFRFTHPARGDVGYGTAISCEKGHLRLCVLDNARVQPGDITCPVNA